MSNDAKHTPVAWRYLSSATNAKWTVQKNYPAQIAKWGGYQVEPLYAADALEATQRLLVECESFLTRINQLASPNPERTFDNAITDLGYVADYARTTLAAIAEHRKANQ